MPLAHGPAVPNRFVLAPLTNTMSHADGTLSDDEIRWLTMRAEGGFGMVTTAASHVHPNGQGFPGQMGVFSDRHLPGLEKLATGIRDAGAISALQLHHAGTRAYQDVPDKVAPSADAETGARALTTAEVGDLIEAFVAGAVRAEKAGFDGVQIHGAHGYIITSFLSPTLNVRDDHWGGSVENRQRLLFDIITGVRAATSPTFQVGVRISTERFGLPLAESIGFAQRLLGCDGIDYLDLSLWDVDKSPDDTSFGDATLLSHFAALDRGSVLLGVAGKIRSSRAAIEVIDGGLDFVTIGHAGIVMHDFPRQVLRDPHLVVPDGGIAERHLRQEGVADRFVAYLRRTRAGMVAEQEES